MAAQLMLRWTYKCNKPFLTFCVFPVLLFIRWFHLLSLKELATGRKSVCQVYEVGRMQGAEDKQVSWDAQENETLCASQFQQCLSPRQPQGINLLMLSESQQWGIHNFTMARGLSTCLPWGQLTCSDVVEVLPLHENTEKWNVLFTKEIKNVPSALLSYISTWEF